MKIETTLALLSCASGASSFALSQSRSQTAFVSTPSLLNGNKFGSRQYQLTTKDSYSIQSASPAIDGGVVYGSPDQGRNGLQRLRQKVSGAVSKVSKPLGMNKSTKKKGLAAAVVSALVILSCWGGGAGLALAGDAVQAVPAAAGGIAAATAKAAAGAAKAAASAAASAGEAAAAADAGNAGGAATAALGAAGTALVAAFGALGSAFVAAVNAGVSGASHAMGNSFDPRAFSGSFKAVMELVLCGAIGYFATIKGVFDQGVISSLSKATYNLFLPALLFVGVSAAAGAVPGGVFLAVPALAIVQTLVGMASSELSCALLGISRNSDEGKEVRVCSAFSNSGVLPLIMVASLFGASAAGAGPATAFISLFLLGWSPIFWGWGSKILENPAASSVPIKSRLISSAKAPASVGETLKQFLGGLKQKLTDLKFFSPPILACFAGLAVGVIKPLFNLLASPEAPLALIYKSITAVSLPYTTVALTVLAGSLAMAKVHKSGQFVSDSSADPAAGGSEFAAVASSDGKAYWDGSALKRFVAIAATRFGIVPLVMSTIILGARKAGLIPQDPILAFVLLLQSCMPSTKNGVIMLQLNKNQKAAESMSQMVFAQYLFSIIPVTILSSLFLSMVGL